MPTTPPTITITWSIVDDDVVGAGELEHGEITLTATGSTPGEEGRSTGDDVRAGAVSIETDADTAAEIRQGSLSPQHALLLGRIVVSADPETLLAACAAIESGRTESAGTDA